MRKNFEFLKDRLLDANKKVSQEELIQKLKDVRGTLITMGTGGSYPVSYYASKIMEECNGCFSRNSNPRDNLFINTIPSAIMGFSYSGKTPSIVQAYDNLSNIKKIIFTIGEEKIKSIFNEEDVVINYKGNINVERSYISIASTFVPMSLLLKYSLKEEADFSEESFQKLLGDMVNKSDNYVKEILKSQKLPRRFKTVEIFSGDTTYTAGLILKSGLIEASMAYPILYEKNDYCHGCHMLNFEEHTDLGIYLLDRESDLDSMFLKNLPLHFKKFIILKTFDSNIKESLREFELALKALFLLRELAAKKGRDLTRIASRKNIGLVKRYYNFSGRMK